MRPNPADNFEYPAHIDRASLDALPGGSGVYLFRDRHGVPVYIGKSVNIRSRVLSHLRTPEEEAMLRDSCRVDYMRTAGEIGALLLESQLIKQLQPAWNVRLKEIAEAFALKLEEGAARPRIVGSGEEDFDDRHSVYGLFTSRNAADEGLRALARRHGLCPALLGLETAVRGRACFAHQLGRCRGACIGSESAQAHLTRLRAALEELQSLVWPHAGRIGIVEQDEGWRQVHVIDRWCYLGTLEGRRTKLKRAAKHFIDIDTYRILARPLLLGELRIVALDA
ncbi:endonuclease [Noviherbaspirillum cavernae]|uniref:Excinuclease cho n=2 Tax=Noviherbaspirillum cavernae TaxID=2320862 RepID=A0A418X3A0_9BURK|nr:endonuclease [Noviherbaspirillum cavernae]